MKIKKYLLLIIVTLLNSAIYSQPISIQGRTKLFNKDFFQRHLDFLESDLFEGRAPGTIGGNLAAKYLALEFDKFKLKPFGDNETYYQNIPVHSTKPLSSVLSIHQQNITTDLKLNNDFLLYHSGETSFFTRSIPLVFAGYGITAPEFNYDDYKDIDVEG